MPTASMIPSPKQPYPSNEAVPNWPDLLNEFLVSRREGILEIFHAARIRESWIQGEAHRYFRSLGLDFAVNGLSLAPRQTADFACFALDGKPTMVAELKVYGSAGYFTKNLTGDPDITRFTRIADSNQRFTFRDCDEHRSLMRPNEGNILKDFFRLYDFKTKHPMVAAYLVLIVDLREPADAFGKALLACDFGGPAISAVEHGDFVVRLWEIKEMSRGA